jgi:hypothetical protein
MAVCDCTGVSPSNLDLAMLKIAIPVCIGECAWMRSYTEALQCTLSMPAASSMMQKSCRTAFLCECTFVSVKEPKSVLCMQSLCSGKAKPSILTMAYQCKYTRLHACG